ncbi:MAG: carboxylesterase/lipase family protein [Hyphomicrobiaceae bacterium]
MAEISAEPIVETTTGKLRGARAAGVDAFKGVPYGASTAGRNRFMPPQKPAKWSGVRDALAYEGRAPQAPSMVQRPELSNLSGEPDTTAETENCLTLNVWTPAVGHGKRPVMVWFHGGAFSYGSANSARLNGRHLAARQDVVVVTVNQRLNILAHLHLADIGGVDFAHSGNAGTLDMVAALQWVRDNIANFGGNAGNVTIFGHSGGGGKVSTLLAMPRAKGLFHRAIIMSGSVVRLIERERAAKLADAVLAELGLGRKQLDELQTMPFQRLIAAIAPAQKRIGPTNYPLLDRYDFGPVVDGDVLPEQPFDPKAPDISRDIPVMIGDTKDESAIFFAPDDKVWHRTLTEAELRERVAKVAGEATERVMAHYQQLHPQANAAERQITTLTDSNFRVRTHLQTERLAARGGAPVWAYSFDWETPVFGGKLKAYHALDVPFVFDNLDVVGATDRSPETFALARCISTTWAAFARTGKPDNASIPHWPAYTLKERATLVLDKECRVVNDEGGARRGLWKDVLRISQ